MYLVGFVSGTGEGPHLWCSWPMHAWAPDGTVRENDDKIQRLITKCFLSGSMRRMAWRMPRIWAGPHISHRAMGHTYRHLGPCVSWLLDRASSRPLNCSVLWAPARLHLCCCLARDTCERNRLAFVPPLSVGASLQRTAAGHDEQHVARPGRAGRRCQGSSRRCAAEGASASCSPRGCVSQARPARRTQG